jgi:hypothetical protein
MEQKRIEEIENDRITAHWAPAGHILKNCNLGYELKLFRKLAS